MQPVATAADFDNKENSGTLSANTTPNDIPSFIHKKQSDAVSCNARASVLKLGQSTFAVFDNGQAYPVFMIHFIQESAMRQARSCYMMVVIVV